MLLKNQNWKQCVQRAGRLSLNPTTHFCPLFNSLPAILSLPRLPQIHEIFPEWKKCQDVAGRWWRSIKRVGAIKEPLICSYVKCYQLLSWLPPPPPTLFKRYCCHKN